MQLCAAFRLENLPAASLIIRQHTKSSLKMFYLLEGVTSIYKSDGRDAQQFSQADLKLLRWFDDRYFEYHTERLKRVRGCLPDAAQLDVSEAGLCASSAPLFFLMLANNYTTFAEKGIDLESYAVSAYDLFHTTSMSSFSEKLTSAMIVEAKQTLLRLSFTGTFTEAANDELLLLILRRFLGKHIAELPAGSIFGERALEDDKQPRSASVVSKTDCM